MPTPTVIPMPTARENNGAIPADVIYALHERLLEIAVFYGRRDTEISGNGWNPNRLTVHSAAALHCLLELALVHAPEAQLRCLVHLLMDSIPRLS